MSLTKMPTLASEDAIPALRHHRAPGGAYLDNAATTLVPAPVLEAWMGYHMTCGVAAGRGGHHLQDEADEALLLSRRRILSFLGGDDETELVFTRSATESLNLLAYGLADAIRPGDWILVSPLEHHSNHLPWVRLAKERKAVVATIPLKPDGGLDYEALGYLLAQPVKLIAVTHTSNVTGHQPDLGRIAGLAAEAGALLVVDAAQAPGHGPMTPIPADFVACSAHKMMAPKGLGALVARRHRLEALSPMLVGGGMVQLVDADAPTWMPPPHRFEGGTLDVAGAVAWAAACDWLTSLGLERIEEHEKRLRELLDEGLAGLPGVRPLPRGERASPAVCTFVVEGVHPHDLVRELASRGVCIRSGHLCAQPLLERLGLVAVNRISLAAYTSPDEIGAALAALAAAVEGLRV